MYEAGNVVAAVAAMVLWLFAADYARWRWWANPGGRLVMCTLVTLALVLTLVAVRDWFGVFFGHELVRLAVFVAALVTTVWAWLIHRRLNRPRRRAKR